MNDDNFYVDNGGNAARVEKWTPNATSGVVAMNVNSSCYSLFIDINSTLYCSLDTQHMVIRHLLGTEINSTAIVAGNGTAGSATHMLNGSMGIYVDRAFSLYVADCGNDRVQLFPLNQRNAATVAGSGAPGTISLNCPTGITLDFDGYMFIVDRFKHRIVGSGPNGFRCIMACSGRNGSASSELSYPHSLVFDTDGSMFVVDGGNDRLQRFSLATNSCGKIIRVLTCS